MIQDGRSTGCIDVIPLHGIDGNPINGVLLRRRGELKRSTEMFYWIDGGIVRFFSPIVTVVLNHRECSST
jgi:hypothetical protein